MARSASDWERASAPGPLALAQDFLNAPLAEPSEEDLRTAAAIRRESESGAAQATLAARYGVGQQLVSAILRGKRLSAAPTLGSARSASRWLASRGFPQPGDALSARDFGRLRELRGVLLAMAMANNGTPLPPNIPAAFDRVAARAPLIISAEAPASMRLAPSRGGAGGFVGTMLATVYDAMRDGTWARLKACPADRCQHVFYDTSRNRTATWCSMSICGNRTKVRSYQQRRRRARAQGSGSGDREEGLGNRE